MKLALALSLSLAAALHQASALQVRVYSAARHDRFTGFPTTPAANPAFLHAALDLTGVGWDATDPTREFTLVSPRYFVGANHYRPAIGTPIRFLAANGVVQTATVDSLYSVLNSDGLATDLLVGRLSTPVLPSSGVRFLRSHLLDTEAAYLGQTLGVIGKTARGGSGKITAINDFGGDGVTGINKTRVVDFTYSTLAGGMDDAYFEVGDSGSPSFVAVNGNAALVGTHTAVLTAAGSYTNVDTFLPAYVAQVNALMEVDGYHLTAAAPKSTALGLAKQITPSVVRAGYPVTIQLTVTNTGALNAANNVKLETTLTGATVSSTSGSAGWVIDSAGTAANARRGGLAAGGAGDVSIVFTPAAPGTIGRTTTWSADETGTNTDSGNVSVIESFRSWSGGLADATPEGDDDRDGVGNLVEYAQGGDPHVDSKTVSGTTQPLGLQPIRLDSASGGAHQVIRFVRRTDAALRQIAYRIETSSAVGGMWTDVTATATELATAPVATGFESVDVSLPTTAGNRQFVRLKIQLSE